MFVMKFEDNHREHVKTIIPGPRSSRLRHSEARQMTGDRCMKIRPSPSAKEHPSDMNMHNWLDCRENEKNTVRM